MAEYQTELDRLYNRVDELDGDSTKESSVVRALTVLLKETLEEVSSLQRRVDELENPRRYDDD
jgi:hypothetical protein